MEDRRDWIRARSRELSAKLGLDECPQIAFQPVSRGQLPIRANRGIYHPSDETQVTVDLELASGMSEREIVYRLTTALIEIRDTRRKSSPLAAAFMVMPSVCVVSSIIAVSSGNAWRFVVWAFMLLMALFLIPMLIADQQKVHLEAIRTGGDPEMALQVLRHPANGTYPFSGRWVAAGVEKAAKRAGLDDLFISHLPNRKGKF